jgi:RimJ/RimL family protein N-acetyltransferase
MSVPPSALLDRVPDEPGLVDFRGLLLSGSAHILGDDNGWLVVDERSPLTCAIGPPGADLLRQVLNGSSGRYLIAPGEDAQALAIALPDWKIGGVTLHVQRTPRPRPARLPVWTFTRQSTAWPTFDLPHVPARLREELRAANERSIVVTTWMDDRPVAFAYAALMTERWFDVSIDTVEPYRRKGAATAAVSTLIDLMRVSGREAVWGADDRNDASLAMAAAMGFSPVARLVLLSPRLPGSAQPLG